MNDCIDTVEAVRRLASDIADHEISRGDKDVPVSVLVYRKRELAIESLYAAFCDYELTTWVRSAAGGLIQLLGTEWKAAAFWRDITIGGLVRASAGEPWLRYEGEAVLLEAGAFQAWRRQRLQPDAPIRKTPTFTWIDNEIARMKAAGEIPADIRITTFAKLLAKRMQQAAQSDGSLRPVKWQYIKNQLPILGFWPISSIR